MDPRGTLARSILAILGSALLASCNRAMVSAPSIKPLPSFKVVDGATPDSISRITTITYFLNGNFLDYEKSLKAEPGLHFLNVRRGFDIFFDSTKETELFLTMDQHRPGGTKKGGATIQVIQKQ